MTGRGRHTVMLGMAPGVGKTYRALQDLRRARDGGRDAVVALLETHGRAETAAQAEGLEQLPRRAVDQRGIVHRELDLPGLLARAERTPAGGTLLALIDELAHSNPPGLEHEKRWQDVEHALAAGIDVLSTVNVQHLESLNDQVAELTGVRVRETVPDQVLVDADDVVVVDLPPAALLQRLRDGQIYPPERVAAALQNFFRIEQLTALRETALLQAAEEVGARRTGAGARSSGWPQTGELPRVAFPVGPPPARLEERGERDRGVADDGPDVVKERILVLVSAGPAGQRVVRRAWRSARRLRAGIDLLHVRRPGRTPTVVEAERLDGVRRLAASLGAELLVEEDDEVEAAAARVARERGTTYLFVGAPGRARGLARWRRSGGVAIDELLRRLPGVDVRIVSERAAGERGERRER